MNAFGSWADHTLMTCISPLPLLWSQLATLLCPWFSSRRRVIAADDEHWCKVYHRSSWGRNAVKIQHKPPRRGIYICYYSHSISQPAYALQHEMSWIHALLGKNPTNPCFSLHPASSHTMKLGGCQVFINCEGERMREYKPFTSEDGKKGTCYLAGQPGTVSV